jgi:hypothetical protein
MKLLDLFKQLLAVSVVIAVLYFLFDLVTSDKNDKPGQDDKNE